jgi:hypothetical protein
MTLLTGGNGGTLLQVTAFLISWAHSESSTKSEAATAIRDVVFLLQGTTASGKRGRSGHGTKRQKLA